MQVEWHITSICIIVYLSLICKRKNLYLPPPHNTNPGCKLSEKSLKKKKKKNHLSSPLYIYVLVVESEQCQRDILWLSWIVVL